MENKYGGNNDLDEEDFDKPKKNINKKRKVNQSLESSNGPNNKKRKIN
jgi:hypothetical protein